MEASRVQPRFVSIASRLPFVPILLAIGGVTLCASLFATWFEVQRGSFSGVEGPSSSQIPLRSWQTHSLPA